jgi:hypothetical protein
LTDENTGIKKNDKTRPNSAPAVWMHRIIMNEIVSIPRLQNQEATE